MQVGLETVIVRGSEHVEAEMAGQTVMMSISQGKYYALEGTARRIWELVAEPTPVSAVVDRLVAEYEVDRAQCAEEVTAFVHELMANGLLEARER